MTEDEYSSVSCETHALISKLGSQDDFDLEEYLTFQVDDHPSSNCCSWRSITFICLLLNILQIGCVYYLWSRENAWTLLYDRVAGGQRWDGRTSLLVDDARRALPALFKTQNHTSLPSKSSTLCISIVADARPYSLVTLASVLANIRDLPPSRSVTLVVLDRGVLPNPSIEKHLRPFLSGSKRSIPNNWEDWKLSVRMSMKRAFSACRKRAPHAKHLMWIEGDALMAEHGLIKVFNDVLDHWKYHDYLFVKLYHRAMRGMRVNDVWINAQVAVPIGILLFLLWRWLNLKLYNAFLILLFPGLLLGMLCLAMSLLGYRNWAEAIHEHPGLLPGHAVYGTGLVMTAEDATNFGSFITAPGFTIEMDNAMQNYADLKGGRIMEYRPHVVQHLGKGSSQSHGNNGKSSKFFWHSRSFERYQKIPTFGKEGRVFTLRD